MATFTSAAGTTLHYELRGDGPLLVCHPGGPGRAVSYLDTLGGADRTRTLLLLDPRGTGESAPAGSYRYTEFADDLVALREHLGVEQFDLLAHSAGTLPALTYVQRHPDRVGRLVLLTPPRLVAEPLDVDTMVAEARQYYGDEPWFADAIEAFRTYGQRDLPPEEVEARIVRSAPLMYAAWTDAAREHAGRPFDADESRAVRAGFFPAGFLTTGFDSAGLAKFTNPVTVIAADRDIYTGPTAPGRIASWFPDATVTWLTAAGHNPWVDVPDQVAAAIEAALTRPPAPQQPANLAPPGSAR